MILTPPNVQLTPELGQLIQLLSPASRPTTPIITDGYLDLLSNDGAQQKDSLALSIMENSLFAEIYQKYWRPIFTRLFALGGSADKEHRELLKKLTQPSENLVLDVACGPGLYTKPIAQALHGKGFAVGLDFSPPMLRAAASTNKASRLSYLRADAHQIPFPADTFDVVTCLAALYLIPEPHIVIRELFRVIKPGGKIVIFTSVSSPLTRIPGITQLAQFQGFKIFAKDEITKQLTQLGFSDINQKITGQGQFISATKT